MVTRILVLSRPDIEVMTNTPKLYLGLIGKWNLISIHGSHEKFLTSEIVEKLHKIGMDCSMSFDFWDITESEVESLEQQGQKYVLFNKTDARRIVGMLQEIKEQEEDSVLIIHCHAGISRSGAVGVFATEFFGYDYREFMLDNPQVAPNSMILRILREESGIGGKQAFMSKEEADASCYL